MPDKSIISLCLFCGARTGVDPAHAELAEAFGAWAARAGVGIVYGGGGIGLMGVAARAALAGGGSVIGFMPQALIGAEIAQAGLTELHIVETLHIRKALMFERSQAIVVLPGGIGTLDEFFEVLTWRDIRIHEKPIYLMGANGYWQPLLDLLAHLSASGFAAPDLDRHFEALPDLDTLAARLVPTRAARLDRTAPAP